MGKRSITTVVTVAVTTILAAFSIMAAQSANAADGQTTTDTNGKMGADY